MNLQWTMDDDRHVGFVPGLYDVDYAGQLVLMEEQEPGDYWYIITARIYNYCESDDFDNLGEFETPELAREAMKEHLVSLMTPEYEYLKTALGV